MAKETKLSLEDFMADEDFLREEEEEEVEETPEEESEEEEEEEEEVLPELPDKKKKKPAKKKKPEPEPVIDEEEEEQEEEEEPSEEEQEEELEEEEDEVSSDEFFEEVNRITGLEVDVDYKGVDPISVQGIALREKAIVEKTLDNFFTELQDKHPKVFQAMQYAHAGKDITDLFESVAKRDYSKIEIKDDDEDLAREILKEYYKSKGIKNEARLKTLIEAEEIEEGGLIKAGKAVVAELAAEQAKEQETKLERAKAEKAEQTRRDKAFVGAIGEIVDTGKLSNFKLTGKTEANEFKNFLLGNIQRTADGGYLFTTKVDQANLEKILQYEYFKFKQGDLSKLIQLKAETENAKKLKLRLQKETKKKTSTQEDARRSSNWSLRDFTK